MGEYEIITTLASDFVDKGNDIYLAIENAMTTFKIALKEAMEYEYKGKLKTSENKIKKLKNEYKDELILNNEGLVHSVALRRYKQFIRTDYFNDILQEGYIGLIKAVETFDNSKGFKFSTYADKCIWNQMYKFIERFIDCKKRHNDFKKVDFFSFETFSVTKNDNEFFLKDVLEFDEFGFDEIEDKLVIDRFLNYCNKLSEKQNKFNDINEIVKFKMKGLSGRDIAKIIERSEASINKNFSLAINGFVAYEGIREC